MQSKGMIMHMHALALVRSLMISSYQLGNETTTTYPSVDLHQIVELVQKVLAFGLEHRSNFLHHLLSGPLTCYEHSDGLQKRFVLHMLLLRLLLLQIIIIRQYAAAAAAPPAAAPGDHHSPHAAKAAPPPPDHLLHPRAAGRNGL